MSSLKDRLSTLNRQYKEIEIQAMDKESSEIAYYRRPTEIEDNILRKAMSEENETILKSLKEGDESVYATLLDMFEKSDVGISIDYIASTQIENIRQSSVKELGKDEPDKDSSQEERDAYVEELKPIFERRMGEIREIIGKDPKDVLAQKAAQSRIEKIAMERAWEIYRRRLIAQALYEKDEDSDLFKRVFTKHEEVPEFLDTDTINTITSKIIEEMQKVRPLPLK